MTEELKQLISETKEHMSKAIEHLEHELAKIRAGKANASILNDIYADAYGTSTPLNQLANISTPDPKTITIQPWDKSLMESIEKGIMQANIGLTPQNDGEVIRLNIPPLTEERRKELVKQVKSHGEASKISLRNVRHKANDAIKSLQKEHLPEDMAKRAEGEIQKITDEYGSKVEKHVEAKEKEIMTV